MNFLLDFCYKHKKAIFIIVVTIFVILFILPIATRHYVHRGAEYIARDDVARYIIKYHELPSNYVTMNGYVNATPYERNDKMLRIGGDRFWNRGDMPGLKVSENVNLKECDINGENYMIDLSNRGTHRLVYTTNVIYPRVFVSEDHYGTCKELTPFYLQRTSNICWIVFAVYTVTNVLLWALLIRKQLKNTKDAILSETNITLLNIEDDEDDN